MTTRVASFGLSALSLVFLAAAGLSAQSGPALPAPARFRADDGTVWQYWDNPAQLARLGAGWSAGVRSQAAASGDFSAAPAATEAMIATPIFSLYARTVGAEAAIRTGSGLAVLPGLSFGLASTVASPDGSSLAVGLLWRPFDLFSLAATGEDLAAAGRSLGFGVALRPLSFLRGVGSALTLTADAALDGGAFVPETAGARLKLGGGVDARLWWDFRIGSPGAELAVTLAGVEAAFAAPRLVSAAPLAAAVVSTGVRFGDAAGPSPVFGRRVLVVEELDQVTAAPAPAASVFDFSGNRSVDLPSLIAAVRRAAADRSVAALVLADLPAVGSVAADQELAVALDAFKRAGKRLHVYARSFEASAQYQIVAARADEIVLDPNGMVLLTGFGVSQLYFKPLLERFGVETINLAPWETKSANNPFTMAAMPDAERAQLERYYGELAGQAQADLAAGRGAKLAGGARAAVDGGPYLTASQAMSAGLVDSLERRADFYDRLEKEYRVGGLVDALAGAPAGSASLAALTGRPLPADPRDAGAWGPSVFAKRAAVVWLTGSIGNDEGQAGASIGLSAAAALRGLREDDGVAAIVLRVESGGGAVLASDNIAAEVAAAVADGKIVAVSMGDVAASGGYYIAAPASRIFALPGTITGSIGVTGLNFNLVGLAEKLGVRVDSVVTSPSAAFGDPFAPVDPEDQARYRAFILDTYDRFVAVVAAGRKMAPESVRALGEGRIWTGREALANGLVDELGGLEAAKAWTEREIGGRAEFFDVFPGAAASPLSGVLPGLRAALAGTARAAAAAAAPAWRASLEAEFGPLADRVADLARLDGQALYWWPGVLELPK